MPTTIRVAACQVPDVRADIPAALALMTKFAADASEQGAQLLCFPECFLQGYVVELEHVRRHAIALRSSEFEAVLAALRHLSPVIVFGMIERDGGTYFNSAVVVENGKLLGSYRKTHLLSGEAIFSAGRDYPVFDVDGGRFGINICFDTNFPEAAAAVAAQGAEIILCPANNMMGRGKADKWKHIHNEVRAERAVETGLWVVSSDVTGEVGDRISLGPSAIISPEGMVVAQVPLGETGMVSADIQIGTYREG